MKKFRQLLFKGAAVSLPLGLTLGLVYWLLAKLESLLSPPLRWLLPVDWYFPGFGVLAGIIVILLAGLFVELYLGKYLLNLVESLLDRIPGIKTLYGAIRDLFGFFTSPAAKGLNQAVIVRWNDSRVIGFVTRQAVQLQADDQERVAVYIPLSYQIGGLLIYVTADAIEPLDISPQTALRKVLTADVSND